MAPTIRPTNQLYVILNEAGRSSAVRYPFADRFFECEADLRVVEVQPSQPPLSAFVRSSAWLRFGVDVIKAVDASRALHRLRVAATQQAL